ncbi:peptide deformylase [bacterium]|nr:peptide deformylase [bacterium]
MSTLKIRIYPDPVLRVKCTPVPTITAEIKTLLDDMAETMYQASGIGLAASQVGSTHRVIVVDLREETAEHADFKNQEDASDGASLGLLQLVNPEIISASGKTSIEEGCLSIPGIREEVPRAKSIALKALTKDGQPFELNATGLLAICLQHEIDHLNGVLFIDRLGAVKKQLIKAKLKKLEQAK